MQLYVIYWSFQNSEDQVFATNEFCEFLKEGKLDAYIEGFELIQIAHTPQTGSGIIICKAQNVSKVLNIIKMWRDNYSICFDIKPALTNQELLQINSSKDFWSKN